MAGRIRYTYSYNLYLQWRFKLRFMKEKNKYSNPKFF